MRPLNRQEQSDGFAWRIEKNSMQQVDPATREPEKARDQKYALDHIFGPKQSTRAIYEETTQSLIRKLVNGFNSTVFAYGQTSSGKTHTMRGTADEPGIIAMAVQEVFGLIESLQDREFLLRVSYMEVCCGACAAIGCATLCRNRVACNLCSSSISPGTLQGRHQLECVQHAKQRFDESTAMQQQM